MSLDHNTLLGCKSKGKGEAIVFLGLSLVVYHFLLALEVVYFPPHPMSLPPLPISPSILDGDVVFVAVCLGEGGGYFSSLSLNSNKVTWHYDSL